MLDLVALIPDLPDKLFQQVFHGHDAHGPAVGVQDHGHVDLRLLEVGEEVGDAGGLGDGLDRPDYLADRRQILRPANYGPQCPGRGIAAFHMPFGDVCVLNLLGRFTLEGGLLFRKELAENHYEVDSDETEEGVTSRPFRLREWWDQEEEYNDVPLLGGFLNIRYPFTLARKYKLFAQLGCSVSYAFNVELLPGNKRQTTHITLGYCF